MQICILPQTDNQPTSNCQFFTGRMPFLPPNQQYHSTEGKVRLHLFHVIISMTILFVSVYIGDYLVLTYELDTIWHLNFNCTNSTKDKCHECHPGSFANQSMYILYSLVLLEYCLNSLFCIPFLAVGTLTGAVSSTVFDFVKVLFIALNFRLHRLNRTEVAVCKSQHVWKFRSVQLQ